MRAHRIDAQAGRQAALVGVGTSASAAITADSTGVRSARSVVVMPRQTLMEASRQVGGDPVTLWDAVFGRLRHNLNIASYLD